MKKIALGFAAVFLAVCAAFTNAAEPKRTRPESTEACVSGGAAFAQADAVLSDAASTNHFPGAILVVLKSGQIAHCKAIGVSDVVANTPVDFDTVFRIASMSKSVTGLAVLQLRDRGKLQLTDPAAKYIPELPRPSPAAQDRSIRVLDLLAHTAGFVTDDPWGDRQLPMSEADFSRYIAGGIPAARPPGVAYEYSNTGYALLGRIVTRASGVRYQDYIQREILQPLGMSASGFDPSRVPSAKRAKGYRFEDGRFREEPVLGDGAYASMGGMQVSARDYIRYVNFVLDGWRTSADSPYATMIARATRRELAQPTSFPRMRAADSDEASCPASLAYSYGMHVVTDCRFTNAMTHSGGLPGYGSNVLFLPQHDAAVFLFVNRTYAPAATAVRKIAARLADDGVFASTRASVSPAFTTVGDAIGKMIAATNVDATPGVIANNLYADRDLAKRNLELRQLLERLGPCTQQPTYAPTHNLAGAFTYACERGTLRAEVLLAPTSTPQLQQLEFSVR